MKKNSYIRTGHGNAKGRPHVETPPVDELPPALPYDADRAERSTNGRFTVGNTVGRRGRVRPGIRGHASMTVDPSFAPFQRWGRRYAAHRRTELAKAHGGTLSAGVSALIESAGEQLAGSRFLHWKGSQTGDGATLKLSSMLANDARQNELAAWSLAALEAASRPKGPTNPLLPWMTTEERAALGSKKS